MRQPLTLLSWLLLVALASPVLHAGDGATTPLWGRYEQRFTAEKAADPDIELTVAFTAPSGRRHNVSGFWDGGRIWRVRFMANETGRWRYHTRSQPAVTGLDQQQGTFECRATRATSPFLRHGAVGVARDRYHLEHADGTPFFWLGDTVWCGPGLSTPEDWKFYLDDRAGKRFSVIQFNAVSPWRTAPTDRAGQVAFTGQKNIQINPGYFQRLDEHMDAINARGLLAAPVLLWALRKEDPGNYLPEEDVIRLIRYQVARYGAHHVIWILAGDNPYPTASAERWKRIGRAVFGGQPHAPVTTHPTGMNWPWETWREEKWLDIFGYQSGHGDDAKALRWIHSGPPKEHWRKPPPRPIINLEPPYEDHLAYQSRQPHSAYNVRRAVYWSLLSTPPAGVTYGAHGIWSWQTEEGKTPTDHPRTGVAKTWRQALALPGSTHMKHLAELFTSLPWWQLRPADDLLAEPTGRADPARQIAAARTDKGDLALFYLPVGGEVTLKPGSLAEGLRAAWFDPRTGQHRPAQQRAPGKFQAPDQQDWLLVLRQAAGGAAAAPVSTQLAIQDAQFTLNGKPTFLLGISYYGALGASEDTIRRDLTEMQRHGFNWIRIWANWAAFGQDASAVAAEGHRRAEGLKKLQWLVAECNRRGLIVDVSLSRGNGVTGPPRLQTLEAHGRAVEILTTALQSYRNWYLDLSNERNIKDRRFSSIADLKELREVVRKLDPQRLVTASHAGDIRRDDLREYLLTVQVDLVTPHRPRQAESAGQTEAKSREYRTWMKELGRAVPLHYQEPFRRGFGKYQPRAADFLTDLRGARAGGAAGWCFHNGDQRDQPDGRPRRSFDLRASSLFEQLDAEEQEVVRRLSEIRTGDTPREGRK